MLKVLFVSSENEDKFGVTKVINSLKKNLKNKIKIKYSNKIFHMIKFRPDVIHIHGCWKIRLILFFILSKIFSIKIIISPHGMINPVSFNQKKIKKIIGWHFYQKIIFFKSNLIIVNSTNEKNNLKKKLNGKCNIIVIPHGINIKKKINYKNISTKSNLKFVFFSRIHPSKNLHKLIELWKSDKFFDKYSLSIFGEITDESYFEKLFHNSGKNFKNIHYLGALKKNLQNILSKYDIFIMPSRSENFGLVVLEALSSGLFVLVNKNLPWQILEKNHFGKSFIMNKKNLIYSIKKINQMKNKIRNKKYKIKILNFLKVNYNWEKISEIYKLNYYSLVK